MCDGRMGKGCRYGPRKLIANSPGNLADHAEISNCKRLIRGRSSRGFDRSDSQRLAVPTSQYVKPLSSQICLRLQFCHSLCQSRKAFSTGCCPFSWSDLKTRQTPSPDGPGFYSCFLTGKQPLRPGHLMPSSSSLRAERKRSSRVLTPSFIRKMRSRGCLL